MVLEFHWQENHFSSICEFNKTNKSEGILQNAYERNFGNKVQCTNAVSSEQS